VGCLLWNKYAKCTTTSISFFVVHVNLIIVLLLYCLLLLSFLNFSIIAYYLVVARTWLDSGDFEGHQSEESFFGVVFFCLHTLTYIFAFINEAILSGSAAVGIWNYVRLIIGDSLVFWYTGYWTL